MSDFVAYQTHVGTLVQTLHAMLNNGMTVEEIKIVVDRLIGQLG